MSEPNLQLQDVENVLALYERFSTKKIVDEDELQFPYIDDKLCVLDPAKTVGAKGKVKFIKEKFVEIRMTDPIITNFIKTYAANDAKSYKYKAVMCMIFYFLSKIHDLNNNNKTLLEAIIQQDPKYQTMKINILVRYIGATVAHGASTNDLIVGLKHSKVINDDKKENELISQLEADYKLLNKMSIKQFFQTVYTRLASLNNGLLKYLYQHVQDNLATAENEPIHEKPIDQIEYIRDKLKVLDTAACVHIHDDDDVLGRPFTEYTMDDIGLFININKGYCFAFTYLGTNIMGSRGNIGIRALGTIPPNDRLASIKGLGRYYSKVSPLANQQADLFDTASAYKGSERNVLVKWLQTNNLSAYFQDPNLGPGPFKLTKPLERKELERFFTFMIEDYADMLMLDNMQLILKLSCGTIFDLIGFLGWICYSDDTSVVDNTSGKYFDMSQYCLGLFTDVCEKLKTIPVEGLATSNNVFDAIKDFRFGKSTLTELLKGVESTCIHGVGASFIRYYMNAYTQCQRAVARLADKHPLEKFLCCPPEEYQKTFKLVPFIFKNNRINADPTSYYPYYTCVLSDQIHSSKNPFNSPSVIIGIDYEGNTHHVAWYNPKLETDHSKIKTPADYIRHLDKPGFLYFKNRLDINTKIGLWLQGNRSALEDIIAIPSKIQSRRRPLFKILCDYTIHVCRTMSQVDDVYKRIFKTAISKRYDPISMEDVPPIPKFLSMIDLTNNQTLLNVVNYPKNVNANSSKKRFHLAALPDPDTLLDINASKYLTLDEKLFYVDTLENVTALPYSVEDNGDVVVTDPYKRINITRAVEYAKLLGLILAPQPNVKPSTYKDNLDVLCAQFEDYYLKVQGQSSNLTNIMFADMELKFFDDQDKVIKSFNKTKLLSRNFLTTQLPEFLNSIPTMSKEAIEIVQKLAKIMMTTHVYNAGKKFIELFELFSQNVITGNIQKTVDHVITSYTITMTYFLLVNTMFFRHIEANIENIDVLMQPPQTTLMAGNYIAVVQRLFQEDYPEDPVYIFSTMYSHQLTMLLSESLFDTDVQTPSLAPFYFQELSKEVFLLRKLTKKLLSSENDTNVDMIFTMGDHKIENIIKMQRMFDKSLPILNETFPYYKENPDLALKKRDYQESIRLRLEYLVKMDLVSRHETKFIKFGMFEQMLEHIFSNKDMMNPKNFDAHIKTIYDRVNKTNMTFTDADDFIIQLANLGPNISSTDLQTMVWCVVIQAYFNLNWAGMEGADEGFNSNN